MGRPFKQICPKGHDKLVVGRTISSRACNGCRRDKDRARRTGCSVEMYSALYAKQNGKCAVCFATGSKNGQQLAADHNHTTGQLRGLLCRNCNLALGNAGESTAILAGLIDYLTFYKGSK